jgi:ABC-type phosphate/phosphonate transport system substrate-binding protein
MADRQTKRAVMRRMPIVLRMTLLLAALWCQRVGGEDGVFEVGYSAGLFYDVDINDARAATQVWVGAFTRKMGEVSRVETLIFDDMPSIIEALEAKEVDLMILPSIEYLEIRRQVPVVPLAVSARQGTITYEYGLLVRRGSGLQSLEGLRGRKLIIEAANRGRLPWVWMETLLLREGLPPNREFFGQIEEMEKVSRAVLPVFFGQADACVANMESFATMAELNPQIGEILEVLILSPSFCRGPVCARKDFLEEYGDRLQKSLLSLQMDPQGQQLLRLFHVDGLVPFEEGQFGAEEALLAEYENLAKKGAK